MNSRGMVVEEKSGSQEASSAVPAPAVASAPQSQAMPLNANASVANSVDEKDQSELKVQPASTSESVVISVADEKTDPEQAELSSFKTTLQKKQAVKDALVIQLKRLQDSFDEAKRVASVNAELVAVDVDRNQTEINKIRAEISTQLQTIEAQLLLEDKAVQQEVNSTTDSQKMVTDLEAKSNEFASKAYILNELKRQFIAKLKDVIRSSHAMAVKAGNLNLFAKEFKDFAGSKATSSSVKEVDYSADFLKDGFDVSGLSLIDLQQKMVILLNQCYQASNWTLKTGSFKFCLKSLNDFVLNAEFKKLLDNYVKAHAFAYTIAMISGSYKFTWNDTVIKKEGIADKVTVLTSELKSLRADLPGKLVVAKPEDIFKTKDGELAALIAKNKKVERLLALQPIPVASASEQKSEPEPQPAQQSEAKSGPSTPRPVTLAEYYKNKMLEIAGLITEVKDSPGSANFQAVPAVIRDSVLAEMTKCQAELQAKPAATLEEINLHLTVVKAASDFLKEVQLSKTTCQSSRMNSLLLNISSTARFDALTSLASVGAAVADAKAEPVPPAAQTVQQVLTKLQENTAAVRDARLAAVGDTKLIELGSLILKTIAEKNTKYWNDQLWFHRVRSAETVHTGIREMRRVRNQCTVQSGAWAENATAVLDFMKKLRTEADERLKTKRCCGLFDQTRTTKAAGFYTFLRKLDLNKPIDDEVLQAARKVDAIAEANKPEVPAQPQPANI